MKGDFDLLRSDHREMPMMQQRIACLRMLTFVTKIAEIAMSSIILGLYVGVYQWLLVYGNAYQMVLPFSVCGSFLLITALICLAQLSNHETPMYLVIAYDVQGALLFAAVGAVCLVCWTRATGEEIIGPPPIPMPAYLDRPAILTSAILGIVNSAVYVLDAVLTYMDRPER